MTGKPFNFNFNFEPERNIQVNTKVNSFIQGYKEARAFVLDLEFEYIMKEEQEQCEQFVTSNEALLEEACDMDYTPYDAGVDFYFSRNGHGTNGHGTRFWDRGLGETGRALDKAAKVYGSTHCYEYHLWSEEDE